MPCPPKRTVVIFGLSACCLVSAACSDLLKKQPSDAALAANLGVIDCEWKAADQYDDNRYKAFAELVHQVMNVCAAQLSEARLAFGRTSNDKHIEEDEYRETVEIISNARVRRQHIASSPTNEPVSPKR
jgi:hypothetical protein